MKSFTDFLAEKDPCWKGYKQVGMKKKGKRKVPNCVPVNEEWKFNERKFPMSYGGHEIVRRHSHTSTVHGKKVEVSFTSHPNDNPDEHSVSFEVNHTMEAPGTNRYQVAKDILKHVTKVTKEFATKHNPKILSFQGTDLDRDKSVQKSRIYKNLAKRAGHKIKTLGNPNIFGGHEHQIKLREEWSRKDFSGGSIRIRHDTEVLGRKVGLVFHHDPEEHENHEYNVYFHVNSSTDGGGKASPKEAKQILHHVNNVTKEFVKEHRPRKLSWEAEDKDPTRKAKKSKIYSALAKRHGLDVSSRHADGYNIQSVKLREEWSYEKKYRPAFNMTSHFHHHDAEIDGHKVRTTIVHSSHSPDQHTVSFTVDGNLSAEKGKDHKISTAKKIISHVRNKTKEYIEKHNPKEVNFSAMDEDPKKQNAKTSIYQKLAKKAGAKITSKNTGEFTQNRLKLREGSNTPEHDFHDLLHNYAHFKGDGKVDLYHEAPGHVKKSIEKHGFNSEHQDSKVRSVSSSDDGIFGTIGQPSDYVTQKKKTIVHMRVPRSAIKHFGPDMPYGNRPGSKTEDPHHDFVDAHGRDDGKGGDVYFNHSRAHKFIHKITEVG